MWILSFLKNIKGSILLVALASSIIGFLYIKGLKTNEKLIIASNSIKELSVQAKAYQATNASLLTTIDEWSLAQERFQAKLREMEKAAIEASELSRRYKDVLSKHNLKKLAKARPGRIEKIINAGTADSFRMLECSSGYTKSCRNRGKKAKSNNAAKASAN